MLSWSPLDELRKCRVGAISKGIYFLERRIGWFRWNFGRLFGFFFSFSFSKMVKYDVVCCCCFSSRVVVLSLSLIAVGFPFFMMLSLFWFWWNIGSLFFFLYSCRCYFLCGISRNGILFLMIIRFVFWWRKANTLPNLGKENGMTKCYEIYRVYGLHCATPLDTSLVKGLNNVESTSFNNIRIKNPPALGSKRQECFCLQGWKLC